MCLLISHSVYKKIFGRKTDPPLDEVELMGTHYERWKDIMYGSIARLRQLEWKDLYIDGVGGARLKAMMHDVGSDKTAVLCHGYRTHHFCNTAVAAGYFLDRGYNVILLILRGHEGSEGDLITFGAFEHKDLLLWLDMFEEKMHLKKIVLYGISLGFLLEVVVADHRGANVFQRVVFPVIFTPILHGMRHFSKKDGFDIFEGDTRKSLAKTKIPVFFLHGAKDIVVPLKDTEENYKACASDKGIYISKLAEHGGCFADGGEKLRKKLDEFLGRYV